MKKLKKKSILVGAAIAGLIAGSAVAKTPVSNNSGNQIVPMSEKGQQAGDHDHKGQHACKGQNSCKGKGGCKSGDNGCKGKNSCKGKGGCATNGSHQ